MCGAQQGASTVNPNVERAASELAAGSVELVAHLDLMRPDIRLPASHCTLASSRRVALDKHLTVSVPQLHLL